MSKYKAKTYMTFKGKVSRLKFQSMFQGYFNFTIGIYGF
jgi:hypothetical protein